MAWPTPADYQEAIQNPHTCFQDPELQRGQPTLTPLGMPKVATGSFAAVFQLNYNPRRWAVKCFKRNIPDLHRRYMAISQHLRVTNLPFHVPFEYLPQGIRLRGTWYPILKMEWVEGETLNSFVERNLGNPHVLNVLADIWTKLVATLRGAKMAHGDLQHGNVLIVRNSNNYSVKLVDYDGMFVPTLRGERSNETGHPSYQHPKRGDRDFNEEIDHFAAIVIYLALCALRVKPDLWNRFNNDDNMLFRRDDLLRPANSSVFYELLNLNDQKVRRLAAALRACCSQPVSQVPTLEAALAGNLPDWVLDQLQLPLTSPIPSATSWTWTRKWVRPGTGQIKRTRKEPIYDTRMIQVPARRTVKEPRTRTVQVPVPHKVKVPVKILGITLFEREKEEIHYEWRQEQYFEERQEQYFETKPEQYIKEYRDVEYLETVHVSGHYDTVTSLAFSSDGRLLVSGSYDGRVRVWEVESGLEVGRRMEHGRIEAVAFSPMGQRVLSGSWDHTVRLWDYNSGQIIRTFYTNQDTRVYSVAVSPNGAYVAAGVGKRVIHVWRMENGSLLCVCRGHQRKVTGVAFAPNSHILVSASSDGMVNVWNAVTGEREKRFQANTQRLNAVAVSSDGRLAAAGSDEGDVFVWETGSGRRIVHIQAHGLPVRAVAFSPDGRVVASGSDDGTTIFWSIANKQEISRLGGHRGGVTAVAWSPNGRVFATGGADNTIRLWEAQ